MILAHPSARRRVSPRESPRFPAGWSQARPAARWELPLVLTASWLHTLRLPAPPRNWPWRFPHPHPLAAWQRPDPWGKEENQEKGPGLELKARAGSPLLASHSPRPSLTSSRYPTHTYLKASPVCMALGLSPNQGPTPPPSTATTLTPRGRSTGQPRQRPGRSRVLRGMLHLDNSPHLHTHKHKHAICVHTSL